MVNNCDAFHRVTNGDTCGNIAHSNRISLAQFNQYNPEIKYDCSGLYLDYYVCVSIIGVDPQPAITTAGNDIVTPTPTDSNPTTTTMSRGVATPTPIQSGMVGTYFEGSGVLELSYQKGITTKPQIMPEAIYSAISRMKAAGADTNDSVELANLRETSNFDMGSVQKARSQSTRRFIQGIQSDAISSNGRDADKWTFYGS
ncbi:hypothetical protein PEX1_059560 [Penicillium expansum]|nr:hypothetical protein PEX1_059560 [Penicillium expansum]